ncbi:MAG: hypothetical protein WCJ89_06580 [Actinomycetes bacterium]
MKRNFIKGILITFLLSLLVGAVPSANAADANPYGGAKVAPPAPTETILVISKGSVKKNLSMNDLMAMKSTNLTIHEPFVKKVQSFRVIPLKAIFALAAISGKDKVQTIALNDYVYTNNATSFLSANGYLAIARGGKAIGYDQGGPIRIIFPDNSKWAKFLDPWNWSLKKISVA